ncbi:MAG: SCO family protein [Pseudomonadales bacterium]|jgi:protein SCO1/2|nr:SCO family protein [Pseudomonadales bacterium]
MASQRSLVAGAAGGLFVVAVAAGLGIAEFRKQDGVGPAPRAMTSQHAGRSDHDAHGDHAAHAAMAANLDRSAIVWSRAEPLRPPELDATNGVALAEQLEGRWSLVFFGFTSCPHVCPTTLGALASVARRPEGGLPDDTQVLFVTVDPAVDDQERVSGYLDAFEAGFIGYTGDAAALQAFADDIGAAFAPEGRAIDHSTSVFVVDPQGRPAGILLRPSDPSRILPDLELVRAAAVEVTARDVHAHGHSV